MTHNWQIALDKANEAKRCGAKTRSSSLCRSPAMNNGRCRMHGGSSTGAPFGSKHGNFKSGFYTQEQKLIREENRYFFREARKLLKTAYNG